MKRICSWCVPNHVMGVTCDFCGSVDCVKSADEEYWLCVDCGSTFHDDVVTHGICLNATTKQFPLWAVWLGLFIFSGLSWFAIVKAVSLPLTVPSG